MRRGILFYLFITGISIVVFALGVIAAGIFFQQPVKPAITPQAVVETPSIAKEKAPPLPVEVPPIVEEKAPLPPVEIPAKIEEKASVSAVIEAQVPPVEKRQALKYEFQKGICYVAWTENGYSNVNSVKAMEQLASLGVEWVGLVTTWYQDRYNSTKIYPVTDKTPSDESLIFAIRKLHELKFKIMLKPHLDLVEGEGKWRGEIESDNPGDWQTWFKSYTDFILYYASLAAKENVELFCIGTELAQSTLGQPELWRDLIKKIREVYKGQLTYAANWDKEFKQLSFWDALDYAGIDPYFPLVCTMRPKTEELKIVWQDWVKEIEIWQKRIDKPVIFSEIGYKSARDATDEPWQHVAIGELDLELQVNCYQALLETFWDKPWFYGVYWWYWGTNPKMGGELNRSFSPQNKPAQEVIKEWYSKPVPTKAY
jgi:hypothetical protein